MGKPDKLEVPEGARWPTDVPYADRQVLGAFANVREDVCRVCPQFYMDPDGRRPGVLNPRDLSRVTKLGICCQGRFEAEFYGKTGKGLCVDNVPLNDVSEWRDLVTLGELVKEQTGGSD